MSTNALTITVYENGQQRPFSSYSELEMDALIEAIEDLWAPTYHSERAFEVVGNAVIYWDSLAEKMLPIPEEWLTKTFRFGVRLDLNLVGDRLPIAPRDFPRNVDVRVRFDPE